jgi:predicted PurR-regulated permease PerM
MVIIRVFFILAGVALVAWLLYALGPVILMFVLSIFFCYMLAPLVRLFSQPLYLGNRELKLSRSVALLLVYMVVGTILYMGVRLLWPLFSEQITEFAAYVRSGAASAQTLFDDADSWLSHLRLPDNFKENLATGLTNVMEQIALLLPGVVTGVLSYLTYLTWLIIVPILSFFLLKDAEAIERGLIELIPNERLQRRTHWLLRDVSRTLAAYIRAQITACIEIGALVTVGFALIGAPYAIVFGVVAGLFEFFPMIGPLMFAIISFGISLTISVKMALGVAIFLAVLRVVQDYIIYPRIVGQGVKMHPLVVILAILGGIEVGGIFGVFLSIPIVALLIVVYNHYLAYKGVQNIGDVQGMEAAGVEPLAQAAPSSQTTAVKDS